MGDSRAADVAEAERLLAVVAADGGVGLPALSAGELCALCGSGQVLAEAGEFGWWNDLTEDGRKKLTTAALDFLIFRGMLRPPGADDIAPEPATGPLRLPMAPALAMIVAARQVPKVVAVGTCADGSAKGAPRMYGLNEEDRPLRAVVAELVTSHVSKPFGPLHRFALLSPPRAAGGLAAWATQAAKRHRARAGQPRVVGVYHHRRGEPITRDRVTVTAGPGSLTAARHRPGASAEAPMTCDRSELEYLLTGMLTGEQP